MPKSEKEQADLDKTVGAHVRLAIALVIYISGQSNVDLSYVEADKFLRKLKGDLP